MEENGMKESKLREMSGDVDDFLRKMILSHEVDYSIVLASILARITLLAMETDQEEGVLTLLDATREKLIESLESKE